LTEEKLVEKAEDLKEFLESLDMKELLNLWFISEIGLWRVKQNGEVQRFKDSL
jgi:hypothetical protein